VDVPNTFPGARIYTQVHAIDAGSTSAIPVVDSDGRAFTVPQPNQTKITPITRLYSNQSQASVDALSFNISTVGYGAVGSQ
jgi:hypothetical protein